MNHIDFTMASKFFTQHRQQYAKTGILEHHRKLMQQHYNFLSYKIQKNVLICTGWIISDDYTNKYKIEIRCVAGKEPCCIILEPKDISPSIVIHMYKDHSLCLHYPPDMKWSGWTPIYQYTVPWIVEWIHYYELYLVNGGKWEGPESPVHFTENDRNIDEDTDD
jgi:hypothetical protein